MKNYPRIHSLSTVGLIHHQENDYLFHHTRTDFMGDSASGKSIIADLLQLIFVGSTAFKSATATLKDKRDPDGLVLITPGKGTNIGYAFLNIESAEEQYITIGAYFESTNKGTKPFIIQSSTEIENGKLVPMHTPLKASDFKDGEDVHDLDELIDVFDEKQLVFKKWERISYYQRILYSNDILPLDLASGDKTLNDYAKIIQSFSRGRTLDTQKSKSLLDFLFGQERGKELYDKYTHIVKELEQTITAYGQNMDAIKLLTNKYQRVCSLKTSLEVKNLKEEEYLTKDLLFHREEYKRVSDSLSVNTEKVMIAFYCLQQLISAAKIDVEISQKAKMDIEEVVETTLESFSQAKQNQSILEKAILLICNLKIKEGSLESFYLEYKKKKERYSLLTELKTKLSEKGLLEFFEHSEWMKGMKNGAEYYRHRINEIDLKLAKLKLLAEYANIDNPDSLIRWAISLKRPLTKVEESLIAHFQTLKRTEPESPVDKDQYLPFPEVLLKKPKIEKKSGGFWIDLNGIREFVVFVPEQRLNIDDENSIKEYFESQIQDIKKTISEFEEEQQKLRGLNEILVEFNSAPQAIEVYRQGRELANFEEIEQLKNIGEESIQSYLSSLKRREAIEQVLKQSEQDYKDALAALAENKAILEKLPGKVAKAEEIIKKIEDERSVLGDILQQFSIRQTTNYDLNFYYDSDDKIETFQTEFDIQTDDLELIDAVKDVKTVFYELKNTLRQKEDSFHFRYPKILPEKDTAIPLIAKDVQDIREVYLKEKARYDKEFEDVVNEFIPSESYRFEDDNKDFADLVAHLLPDIFGYEKVIEEEVIGKIQGHLEQINNKNRDLNSKKIRKIEDLLDDVQMAVGEYADTIRKINRFFGDGERRISGNYKLYLDNNPAKEFPVRWLSEFKKRASEQLNLFEISIADKLSSFISIEEKIVHAFRELTDNHNDDVTIKELLDPNSYLELSLEMQDPRGKSNKGSTGQTYAAIASLCIARLSIVGSKNYEKDSGIRFMPIDEAEGLGSNFDLLYEIAQKYDYQIITFSINPLGRYDEQFIYILHRNPDADININYTPMSIRSKEDIKIDLKEIIEI
tara:strand:+ start:2945 stop:6205 length:3261 start_codon:yes stop_codon:yes gene_type:complete